MPRGRPRKPRLTRMDAAVDAMAKLGFPEEKVRKIVKELLKEYGGNEGWPFIEDNSYTELLEALLRDAEENTQLKTVEDENQLKPQDM
ncbi:Histone-lysine N-methyltransferase [Handroanthus impetiginosus]|uniref:Histone-lysine N-methyltransferase n=1 Tax=Handroanthus impetiginosus TaxID=429701 RepID=A0A2G9I567_9LAMI|nr:Histone-lysine N-methyltransferase [Handroanthus impetiginosus]